MLDAIITIIFIIIPSVVILIAILLGIKRNIYQSIAKLVMTILSIIISAVLVKSFTPTVASSVIGAVGSFGGDFIQYFMSFNMAGDVLKLLSALLMPLVFAVTFILINFVFDLLYIIPGRLLSNKAFAKRALKANPNPEQNTVLKSHESEMTNAEEPHEDKKKINWSKIGLRAGSIMCNILAAVLVLAMFALPINAYGRLASSLDAAPDIAIEFDGDLEEAVLMVGNIDSHPTNRFYSVFNGVIVTYFDRFNAGDGSTVVVSDTLFSVISIVDFISGLDLTGLNSDLLLDFANKLEENIFVKNLATELISDLCNAWVRGEAILGISAPELEGDFLDILLTKLSDCDDITVAIRAMANALRLGQAIIPDNTNESGDTVSMIVEIFTELNADTAGMIKTFVSNEVLTEVAQMPPSMAQNVSGFIDSVLDGIIAVKDDTNLTNEEEKDRLNEEAKAMASVLDMAKSPETIAPEKLVESIVKSSVIANTIQEITDNGSTGDPYGIADALTPEFTEAVSQQLNIQGVEEDSDLYKSIMAMINK